MLTHTQMLYIMRAEFSGTQVQQHKVVLMESRLGNPHCALMGLAIQRVDLQVQQRRLRLYMI